MEIDLSTFRPKNKDQIAWVYNGIDNLIEYEVLEELRAQIAADEPCVRETYDFALAKQAPIMEMELRGIRVDPIKKQRVLNELSTDRDRVQALFDHLTTELFGGPCNPRSHQQVKDLLYGRLGFPSVKARNSKGAWVPTVNEEALESLKQHFDAIPFCNFVLTLRDMGKQISFLKSLKQERLHTSFLIAGTVTGRLASKYSDFGAGTNLQNVDRRLRYPFVPDPGYYLLNIDLEQADSRNVGARIYVNLYETHGPEYAGLYLDACESGDLHTRVASLVWPDLGWTDERTVNRALADQPYYRQNSYRDTSKRQGHATNYRGKPRTVAKRTHTPTNLVEAFQEAYLAAFPIPEWHAWIDEQFATYPGQLTTMYGRRRHFYGRHNDDKTLRDATAYEPQSMTGHQIDRALHAVWRKHPHVILLLQVHDSITAQIPKDRIHEVPEICETMEQSYALTLPGDRKFIVPVEAKVGLNWGDYDEDTNPRGLRKHKDFITELPGLD